MVLNTNARVRPSLWLSKKTTWRNSSAGSQTDLVLLVFSKAFDKVSHQTLLNWTTMESEGTAWNWYRRSSLVGHKLLSSTMKSRVQCLWYLGSLRFRSSADSVLYLQKWPTWQNQIACWWHGHLPCSFQVARRSNTTTGSWSPTWVKTAMGHGV